MARPSHGSTCRRTPSPTLYSTPLMSLMRAHAPPAIAGLCNSTHTGRCSACWQTKTPPQALLGPKCGLDASARGARRLPHRIQWAESGNQGVHGGSLAAEPRCAALAPLCPGQPGICPGVRQICSLRVLQLNGSTTLVRTRHSPTAAELRLLWMQHRTASMDCSPLRGSCPRPRTQACWARIQHPQAQPSCRPTFLTPGAAPACP